VGNPPALRIIELWLLFDSILPERILLRTSSASSISYELRGERWKPIMKEIFNIRNPIQDKRGGS
jgi:hypothetical protein